MKDNFYYGHKDYDSVGSVDIAGDYEFDILLVVKRKSDNTLFYIKDSGCSCPCPFEDMGEADLNRISTAKELKEFEKVCLKHKPYRFRSLGETQALYHEKSLTLYKKVFDLLRQ